LIHYSEEADLSKYGHLRGVIVDINRKVIVCNSFGYTPSATLDTINDDSDGSIKIIDDLGNIHSFPRGQYYIKYGFEGVVIRAFKHDGIVYRSSYKRIQPNKSHWGSSENFTKIYERLNGPSDDVLFGPERYSPWIYTFLLVDSKLLVGTKQNVGGGYIVLLDIQPVWSNFINESPYTKEEISLSNDETMIPLRSTIESLSNMNDIPDEITSSFIHYPQNVSLQEANYHLQNGFYQPVHVSDIRLGLGEFVIIYLMDESGESVEMLKVVSTPYKWRCDMRANNPNLKHRFFELSNYSNISVKTDRGVKPLLEKIPLLPLYSQKSIQDTIRNNGPFIVFPEGQVMISSLSTKDSRLHEIWLAFLASVPLQQQYEVSFLYDIFINEREEVTNWIISIANDENISLENISPRVKSLIATSRSKTSYCVQNKRSPLNTFQLLLQEEIQAGMSRKKGQELYQMINNMKLYLTKKKEEKEKEKTADTEITN
jgi:hypothetical protein